MAKGANQKLKLLYLLRILMENTDDTHGMEIAEIIAALNQNDISAERKSLYSDIECLRQFGVDIIGEKKGGKFYYYVGSRQFELPELKLLVDSVQSAKFITAKKSNELIKKLEKLGSKYEATKLQRQVFVAERNKTVNEGIYYNVDEIHSAIGANQQITFQYFQWDMDKKMVLKREGALYEISPWALTWADENYYLVGYDEEDKKIKHFRVDKMLNIKVVEKAREGQEFFTQFDMAVYTKKMFGMFDGEEQMVKLECEKNLAGVIIDRFGKDVMMIKSEDGKSFTANVKAAVSRQFLGWIISLGEGVRIVGPDTVVTQMKKEILRLRKQYT